MADFDFSTLVTDRKMADTDALKTLLRKAAEGAATAEELARLAQPSHKGAYNYTDLNRVTACMDALNTRLTGLGYMTGYQRIQVPHKGGGGEPTGRLPEGYTELAWIKFTGTQQINTEVSPSASLRVEMGLIPDTSGLSAHAVFGSDWATNGFFLMFYQNNLRFHSWGAFVDVSDYQVNSENQVVCTHSSFSVNGKTYPLSGPGPDTTYPIVLGWVGNPSFNGEGAYKGIFSSTYIRMYEDETLIRDYVPCMNAAGAVGLYDLVTAEFYGNAGTGSFIAGPEVYGNDEHTLLLLHGEDLTDSSKYNQKITNNKVTVNNSGKFGKSLYLGATATTHYEAPPEPEEPKPTKDTFQWYEDDIPTDGLMSAYLANAAAIRAALALPEGTPETPSAMRKLRPTEANHIEIILLAVEDAIRRMRAAWFYCGETYCGEV